MFGMSLRSFVGVVLRVSSMASRELRVMRPFQPILLHDASLSNGWKARARDNIDAIRLSLRIESEKRHETQEDAEGRFVAHQNNRDGDFSARNSLINRCS
jgi:hypothetical protein